MKKKSVSSHGQNPPPTASPMVPPIPPSSTQEHIGGTAAVVDLTKTTQSSATDDVNKPDAQLSYLAMIIRRDMEVWEAFGRPKHFAQRRADFAASTLWFRGIQCGYWSTNADDPRNGKLADGQAKKYCTGIYVAGCPPPARYVDSEVIITSINGPENIHKHTADRKREVGHNLEERIPVGVAVSKDAGKPDEKGVTTFPCPIPEGLDCVVLGWFLVTHMWSKPAVNTKGETKTVWMVRLEKVDLSERSWWSNGAHGCLPYPSVEERDFVTKAAKEACQTCGQTSVRLFEPHFVCLNDQCTEWFRVDGEHVEAEPSNLVYSDDFLGERYDRFDTALAPRPLEEAYYPSLYPPFEQFSAKNYPDPQGSEPPVTAQNLAARNEALLVGFSCPQCGMANSRIQYHAWHCRNTDCRDADGNVNPFSFHAPPPMVTPELLEAERQLARARAKAKAKAQPEVPLSEQFGYQGTRDLVSHVAHELDFGGGSRVTILRPKPGGLALAMADALFEKVQEDAASGVLGLARRSVSANGGLTPTNHFVENYGKRYDLPFALSDIPIGRAPAVVQDALLTANKYMWEYFGDDDDEWEEFNAIYMAAYLSKNMGMSYHDDGEKNLGNVIGTWTLGGSATFKICVKPQLDFGRAKKGGAWMKPKDGHLDPVPGGCTEEVFRGDLKAAFERGEFPKEEYVSYLQRHMDEHMADPKNERTYARRALASFTVEHGDVVVMWGDKTQRYLEHGVDCRSSMRFAVTMRRVTRDMGTKGQWARLDARLASDKAFTPSWAGAGKRKAGEEDYDEEEEQVEVKPARAARSRAKKSKAEK